jgi:hypothetical protein
MVLVLLLAHVDAASASRDSVDGPLRVLLLTA